MARKPTDHAPNLFLRGKVFYVHRMQNGKRLIQSTGTSNLKEAMAFRDRVLNPFNLKDEREQAEAVLARVEGLDKQLSKIEDGKPATTIGEVWQAYLDQSNRPDSGESTLRQYEFQYEAFAKWFKETHPQTDKEGKPIRWELRQVSQDDVDRYAAHLIKKVSASTFNRHIVLLALVWRVLAKTARLSGNPWKQIERKRFAVHSRRELTVEELHAVCKAAKGEMRLLLGLGIYSGLRLGDAACLDWSNVDMAKGVISLIPMKTARRMQKRVTIPIHRDLHALLCEIPKSRRHGPVMPSVKERYHAYDGALAKDVATLFLSVNIKTGANKLTKAERDAIAQAKAEGQELPAVKPSTKRASADCGFHSLRHTFVSLCAAGGVSQSVVQSLVGHGSPAMTAHYTHIGTETARTAIAALPSVTTAKSLPEETKTMLDKVLADLEGLSKEELAKVGVQVKEMLAG